MGCHAHLDSGEKLLCTQCRHHLPLTNFHLYNDKSMEKVLYGRVALENATALFYYEKKGAVQQLIHNLKYRGHEEISSYLGNWLGTELSGIKEYQKIDVVIPVPLHPRKKRTRGFNQVAGFAMAIAEKLEVDYNDHVLIKYKGSGAQALKERFSRSGEVLQSFKLKDAAGLKGKHILLVDDLITTGATAEACCLTLQEIPDIKLSLVTMAIAR